ncbi:hypothetical protein OI450_06460 [Pectobacterium cacticida]|uniref:Glycosyl transferase n=1 Tax=Pectobacterium cacticida TaxID=69221 RepID=A0ABZ2G784_9GAMM|nr:hypothetical protein [Pectobacterium cacticida]UYX08005.1 hypothetical protein OI450_06460 [Pectobacterium cacticida]
MNLFSYDVWDTLLKRYCKPENTIHTALYWLCLKLGVLSSLPEVFCEVRKRESLLYNNGQEYFISELVFNVMDELGLCSDYSPYDIRDEWDAIYYLVERNATYVNNHVLEMLKNDAGVKIFISDFYSSSSFLSDLLKFHGVILDDGFSSCNTGKSKHRGDLYDIVFKKFSPNKWVHTGDNIYSDIKIAKKKGITTRHISKKSSGYLTRFKLDDEVRISFILISLCLKIIETCHEKKCYSVWFLTREGIFFKRIFDLFINKYNFLPAIEINTHILYVSRVATSCLRFDKDDAYLGYSDAIEQYGNSTDSFLSFFGLNDKFKHIIDTYDTVESIVCNKNDNMILQLFSEIEDKRKKTLSYINETGFALKDSIVVDIGWRGSIQDNLACIPNAKIKAGCYIGLFEFFSTQSKNNKVASVFNQNEKKEKWMSKGVSFWETIFGSCGGSVIGYEQGKVVTKINSNEEKFIKNVIEYQNILYSVTERIVNDLAISKLDVWEVKKQAVRGYKKIVVNPSSNIADIYMGSLQNEIYGNNSFIEKNVDISFFDLMSSIISTKKRKVVVEHIKRNGWREGVLKSRLTTLPTKIASILVGSIWK